MESELGYINISKEELRKLNGRITSLEKEVEDWKGNVGDLEGVCSEYRDEIQCLTAEVARLKGLLQGWQTGQQEDAQTIENLTAALAECQAELYEEKEGVPHT